MYINRINSILPIKRTDNVVGINRNALQQDVFEKSTDISFKGGKIFEPYRIVENDDVGFFLYFLEKRFKSRTDKATFKRVEAAYPKFSDFVATMSNAFEERPKDFYNSIEKHFMGNGINSYQALSAFMNIYMQRDKELLPNAGIDYLRIYGSLNEKSDINKFPELLIHLYDQNTMSDIPEEFDPNPLLDFLKVSGINKFEEFDEHFKVVAPMFNNFKGMLDVTDAIDYLRQTYPQKLDFINSAIKDSKFYNQSTTPEKVYSKYNKLIDYLYEANNGESLEPLSSIRDVFLLFDKIKPAELKPVASLFHNFETPEDEIEFMDLLAASNTSCADYNKMPKQSFFEEDNLGFIEILFNKPFLVGKISSLEQIKEEKANELYLKFGSFYNAVYKDDDEDNERIKSLSSLINKFDINSGNSLLNLFNSIYQTNKKKITKEEFINFVDLMNYCESKDVCRIARKEGVTPFEIILRDKEQFLSIEKDISEFLNNDNSLIFAGKTPYEVYAQFKSAINKEPEKITEILRNIVNLNVANIDEYKKIIAKAEDLKQYFDSNNTFKKFIRNNNIKFNSTEEDENHLQNCLKTFALLKENAPDKLQYYTESDFIAKSGIMLNDFYEEYPSEEKQIELLGLFADTRVPSVDAFKKYIKGFKDNKGKTDNLITRLKKLPPEIKFRDYSRHLGLLNKKLSNLELPFKINNSNILNIEDKHLLNSYKYNNQNINQLLNAMFNAKDSNFVIKLPKATAKANINYDKYSIANEIATEAGKTEESYKNIINKLGLSKEELGLEENCNESVYTKSIFNKIPQELIELINSSSWAENKEGSKDVFNLSMHAKLRFIDRFALCGNKKISDLNTEETKKELNNILKTVYYKPPQSVTGRKDESSIIMLTPYKNDIIKSIFGKDGRLISIMKKD